MIGNYYETLGVFRDASAQELEHRYRRLRERLTEEVESGSLDAGARLSTLDQAYKVLSTPALRIQYDSALASGESRVAIGAAPVEASPPAESNKVNLPAAVSPLATPTLRTPHSGRMRRYLIRRLMFALGPLLVFTLVGGYFILQNQAEKPEGDLSGSARAYAEAIVAFEHDHGGRPPLLNSADWPNRLQGPVDDRQAPYLKTIPKYVQSHSFDVIQTRSSSGFYPSVEAGLVQVTSTTSPYYLQYVPYGSYQGYLLIAEIPDQHHGNDDIWLDHQCEALGDPVRVSCTT